jgi:hypothetical protein
MVIKIIVTVAKKWRQLKCLVNGQIKYGCYLAIKRNEVLIHATTWMNFENIILDERSQSQKTITLRDSSLKYLEKVKLWGLRTD